MSIKGVDLSPAGSNCTSKAADAMAWLWIYSPPHQAFCLAKEAGPILPRLPSNLLCCGGGEKRPGGGGGERGGVSLTILSDAHTPLMPERNLFGSSHK